MALNVESQVLLNVKANTTQARRELDKLSKKEKEAVAAAVKSSKGRNEAIESQIASIAKIGVAVGVAIVAYQKLSEAIDFAAKRSQLQAASGGADIKAIQNAANGLITTQESLQLAADLTNGTFRASQKEMEIASKFIIKLRNDGNDLEDAYREVTKALVEANTEGLKQFGVNIEGQSGSIEAYNALLDYMGGAVEGIDFERFGDEGARANIRLSDSIDRLKDSMARVSPIIAGITNSFVDLTQLPSKLLGFAPGLVAQDAYKELKDAEQRLKTLKNEIREDIRSSPPELYYTNQEVYDELLKRQRAQILKLRKEYKKSLREALDEGSQEVLENLLEFDPSLRLQNRVIRYFKDLRIKVEREQQAALDEKKKKAAAAAIAAEKRLFKQLEKEELARIKLEDESIAKYNELIDLASELEGKTSKFLEGFNLQTELRYQQLKLTLELERRRQKVQKEAAENAAKLHDEEMARFREMQYSLDEVRFKYIELTEANASFFSWASLEAGGLDLMTIALNQFSSASKTAFAAWLEGSRSMKGALKDLAEAAMLGIAQEMFARSIFHGAMAIGSLASGNFAAAAFHGKAAAAFAAGTAAISALIKWQGIGQVAPTPTPNPTVSSGSSGVSQTTFIVVNDPFNDDPRASRRRLNKAFDRVRDYGSGGTTAVIRA